MSNCDILIRALQAHLARQMHMCWRGAIGVNEKLSCVTVKNQVWASPMFSVYGHKSGTNVNKTLNFLAVDRFMQ